MTGGIEKKFLNEILLQCFFFFLTLKYSAPNISLIQSFLLLRNATHALPETTSIHLAKKKALLCVTLVTGDVVVV